MFHVCRGHDQPVEGEGEERQAWFRDMWEGDAKKEEAESGKVEEEDGFGDDFDDFNEGGGGDDDDFGDFDEAEEEEDAAPTEAPPPPEVKQPDILAGLVSSRSLQLHSPPSTFALTASRSPSCY